MPKEFDTGAYEIETLVKDSGRRYRVFLFDDEVPTLFDTGHDYSTDALFAGIEETGLEPERLVITHGDGDHAGAFDAIVEEYGVETYVHPAEEFEHEHEPDVHLSDGDMVGGFTTVHTPGHTAGHLAFVHEERGVAVMGDAVFGSDLRGLPAGYFVLPPAVYSEDLNQADDSLAKLVDYDFDVGLCYHGSSVWEDASEKLEAFVNFPGAP